MKRTALFAFALAPLQPAAALAELSPAQLLALQAVYGRCVDAAEAGTYCDGFRDGLIYLREYPPVPTVATAGGGSGSGEIPLPPVDNPLPNPVGAAPDGVPAALDGIFDLPANAIFPKVTLPGN
jgi:hypothetical protein